uniref:Sorting nexin 1 n=1 Tax=Latimeria chalumnae TaxID=7897 RepID=H3B821_LATCH
MATSSSERIPPPFPESEDSETAGATGDGLDSDTEGEDIFTGSSKPLQPKVTITQPASSISKSNGPPLEEEQDLFVDATVELSLDSPQNNRKRDPAKPSTSAPSLTITVDEPSSNPQSKTCEELEEEEEEDQFNLNVTVTDPEKIGDGMNAYMVYKVNTQTNLSMFKSKRFTVKRRFSDFLGLYDKLCEKNLQNGLIIPPPPEKSLLGMTKVKVGKDDSSSTEFVERRRAALERYIQRIVTHPSLLQDPDLREFLEKEELPRAVGTQALSGAGLLKMISRATDAVNKMTIKMNESDIVSTYVCTICCRVGGTAQELGLLWEFLLFHYKDVFKNTLWPKQSVGYIGALVGESALQKWVSAVAGKFDLFEELQKSRALKGHPLLITSLVIIVNVCGPGGVFDQRMKTWQRWQDAQTMLQKKREVEARLLWANKPDKLQQAKDEITEWEGKVAQYERDFERISASVRKEVIRFEKEKTKDFKNQIVKYLETLLNSQQQLIKYWEAFLPEAKAIA